MRDEHRGGSSAVDFQTFDRLVAERAERWIDELREYCRIPSEAGHVAALEEAASWAAERMRYAGCEVRVLKVPGVPSLVVGEMGSGERTVIAVQHYDVQPAAPVEEWTTPPYEPTVRGGHVYARGVSDNKGPFLIRLQAAEAYREAFGELPVRLRFIVEGEEETGSGHLAQLIDAEPTITDGDAALIESGGRDAKGRPVVVCGVRGIVSVELAVRTLRFDAHSGAAGILPNAAWRLVEALATLRRDDGMVLIDHFHEHVRPPTESQLSHMQDMPFEEEELKTIYRTQRFVGGRSGMDAHVAMVFAPTCTIDGLWAGWTGQGPKTIVPAEARAKLDMRLVPDQDPEHVRRALRRHLDVRGFTDIEMTEIFSATAPYWTSVDDPLVDAADRAVRSVWGQPALRQFSLPGTAPMFQICARRRLPIVSLGGGHPGSRAHGPDENIRLDWHLESAKVFSAFFGEVDSMPDRLASLGASTTASR